VILVHQHPDEGARILVGAGLPMARWTIAENAITPARRVRWVSYAARDAHSAGCR
jgi:hypothetical protein